jgi:hypothetical protein
MPGAESSVDFIKDNIQGEWVVVDGGPTEFSSPDHISEIDDFFDIEQ